MRHLLPLFLLVAVGCEDPFGNGIADFSVGEGGYCSESLDCEGSLLCIDYECSYGYGSTGGGGGECIPSSSSSTCYDNSDCCSDLCLSDDNECHDWCSTGSDCVSGCCIPLQGGGGACAASDWCY